MPGAESPRFSEAGYRCAGFPAARQFRVSTSCHRHEPHAALHRLTRCGACGVPVPQDAKGPASRQAAGIPDPAALG